jgi:hypothetical protein
MAYCEILHKEGWTKGTNCNSWTFRPSILFKPKKANVIANSLENLFMLHKLCDADHEWQVEAPVQALLTKVEENPSVKFRPCDVSKEI